MDSAGQALSRVNDSFAVLIKALHDAEDMAIRVVGQPLLLERGQRFGVKPSSARHQGGVATGNFKALCG